MIEEFDLVILNIDIPENHLKKGDRGTVVFIYDNHQGYEVEFFDEEGYTTAVLTLQPSQIRSETDLLNKKIKPISIEITQIFNSVIQSLTKKQRPYYNIQGHPIKGVNNQYWLIFKHRDADNLFKNIISFLGISNKPTTYKLIRLDPTRAYVFEYVPKRNEDIPSSTLLRTSKTDIIEKFLNLETFYREESLFAGSFIELEENIKRRRKFNLPNQLEQYNEFIKAYLERTKLYRRSTAFFDSGVLKLYEEPLQHIVINEGEIRLLMDWQGFTNQRDVKVLTKLYNDDYRLNFIKITLQTFLTGLADNSFNSTQILAELVRLNVLKIKLVKMDKERGIYHKKTGILTDHLENHILHEGSDNFTRAAHSKNAESITFLYYSDPIDLEAIEDSIEAFDQEWLNGEFSFDLNEEFLQQILAERERRLESKKPIITNVVPNELTAGEITQVQISGKNLRYIEQVNIPDDDLVRIIVHQASQNSLTLEFGIASDHPPSSIEAIHSVINQDQYLIELREPLQIIQPLTVPPFENIEGFRQAIEALLVGNCGTPQDFLYSLAQERPHLWRIQPSDVLDELVYQGILFEHQKSGAQHCLRIMQDFGVAVCADAVGLGKTRLAASVAKLYREENGQAKIAIIAAKKLFPNWEREMAELGFKNNDYELYNKNLMSRKSSNFQDDFNRYGGPDLVIIDEAHEGIRNYKNRIHRVCLQIKERDRLEGRTRLFLLLTATPWNNRREDIYNILFPFISQPEGFRKLGFPPEVAQWFQGREAGVENFTDNTNLFRRVYRELFLQRTRKMLKDAAPDLNLYPKRIAEWLPVNFEPGTENALEQIFTQFEENLYIPFADPIRYLRGSVTQRSLLTNQRRFFLQRAESSMYALQRTIKNFGDRIRLIKERLANVNPDAEGFQEFLLVHYGFKSPQKDKINLLDFINEWEEDYEENEEDEEELSPENEREEAEKRQNLRKAIDNAIDDLRRNPDKAQEIYQKILADCDSDLIQLNQIQNLLKGEFIRDHKREEVTKKVREIISNGDKVLLISTFSDTVIDYYRYMASDQIIASKGLGMSVGSHKFYYPINSDIPIRVNPNNITKGIHQKTGLKQQQIFRLFAPMATCKNPEDRPKNTEEIMVLIGSETLSVGQNLQDADYLINIDLPWNPMILEQRIGRIDRPKQHQANTISIYYANSESQLLRQASRLESINKKLIGELANKNQKAIPNIFDTNSLGASIYGDTLFDDEILPGYIDFIISLVKARRLEQGSLQEAVYQKQETSQELYTQSEILHSEELQKLVSKLGDDYKPNPITLGRYTNEDNEPYALVSLTLDYFGPNGEAIPDQQQKIYWNNVTGEQDGYGVALATAFKTPEQKETISVREIINKSDHLYRELIKVKNTYSAELEQIETLENISITTSERINRIQQRIMQLERLPDGLDRKIVKEALKKLNQGKELKNVQKLLKEYTDGSKANLNNNELVIKLVEDTNLLNLLSFDEVRASSLRMSLASLLLKIE